MKEEKRASASANENKAIPPRELTCHMYFGGTSLFVAFYLHLSRTLRNCTPLRYVPELLGDFI